MASAQLQKILQGKIWRFFGGIRPQELKNTSDCAIEELPMPSLITLPLERHLGPGGQILVQTGDYVKAGQVLTVPGGKRNVPLHASTSGTVISIGLQLLPHPSGFSGQCLTIKPDGKDIAVEPAPIHDWLKKSPAELLERIRYFGIEGLGGAQFQTAAKLSSAIADGRSCNIFIVNGAECEPVATCDDRLMQEKAADIIAGVEIIKHILKPKAVIIAIEDNKPEALAALRQAAGDKAIVRAIPTLYPSGAARNLIKIVTGIEIPYKAHTSDCGIVVDNVETVFAVKQAIIDGIPLIKRVVTVAGGSLKKQGNALVRLGTSVRFVLTHYHLNPERRQRVILGGPMMGFTLPSIDVPITKSTTCVLAPTAAEIPLIAEAENCIRCGRCARVCPSRLVPYQMYAFSRAGDHEKARKCGIADCTECGCCAYVCPSHIRLTGQFRKEKAIQYLLKENAARNERARERMQAHKEREAEAARLREEKKKAALARLKSRENAINTPDNAARANSSAVSSDPDLAARRAAAIAAAQQRAATKKNKDLATKPTMAAAAAGQTGSTAKTMLQPSAISTAGTTEQTDRQTSTGSVRSLNSSARAAAILAQDRAELKAEQAKEPVPFYLRRAGLPKQANILRATWPEPPEREHKLNKVENPPVHEIVVEHKAYHSIYAPAPEQTEERPLPASLAKTRKKD